MGGRTLMGDGEKQLNDETEQFMNFRILELSLENDRLRKKIAEKNKSLDDLRNVYESLEMTNRVKSNFIANMSHELRNPLNSILGFSQVLLEKYFGPLNEKQESYVKDIHESGRDLLALINDILDLAGSDIEINKLDLSHVNIGKVMQGSLNFIRQKAFKHNIDIKFSLSDTLCDLTMNLDKKKMKKIFFNLLSNALNLTPDGGRMIVIAEKIMVKNRDSVAISIFSNRIGIDVEHYLKIPEEVFGNKEDKKNEISESDPELISANGLVELHGGRLLSDIQEGKGTRFTVIFPL
jgi:signal transduction histidine kinase